MKYKYKVNGLDCANCTQKLEDALNKKEEINDCVISFATGMMTFESNQEINDNELLCFMQSIEDEVTIDNLSTKKCAPIKIITPSTNSIFSFKSNNFGLLYFF